MSPVKSDFAVFEVVVKLKPSLVDCVGVRDSLPVVSVSASLFEEEAKLKVPPPLDIGPVLDFSTTVLFVASFSVPALEEEEKLKPPPIAVADDEFALLSVPLMSDPSAKPPAVVLSSPAFCLSKPKMIPPLSPEVRADFLLDVGAGIADSNLLTRCSASRSALTSREGRFRITFLGLKTAFWETRPPKPGFPRSLLMIAFLCDASRRSD